jgi:thiosulfate oxidation carrier complex protein SoxZ
MLNRRDVLACAAALLSVGASAADEQRAFDAETVADVLRALGVNGPTSASGLQLQALDQIEDGATVEVSALATQAGAQRLVFIVDRNPNPLAAWFDLGERVEPQVRLRVKVAESCDLEALSLLPDGRTATARRAVNVTIGGCGVGEVVTDLAALAPSAPQPSRIRARVVAAGADVRVLMSHVMETGLRQDAAGRRIPAWTIRDVSASLNGNVVLRARWGTGVSRNPYLQFVVRGAVAGDLVGIAWTDSRGQQRYDEGRVA